MEISAEQAAEFRDEKIERIAAIAGALTEVSGGSLPGDEEGRRRVQERRRHLARLLLLRSEFESDPTEQERKDQETLALFGEEWLARLKKFRTRNPEILQLAAQICKESDTPGGQS